MQSSVRSMFAAAHVCLPRLHFSCLQLRKKASERSEQAHTARGERREDLGEFDSVQAVVSLCTKYLVASASHEVLSPRNFSGWSSTRRA